MSTEANIENVHAISMTYELPRLASQAALQIHNMLEKREYNIDPVHKLAAFLHESIDTQGTGLKFRLTSPGTTQILERAVSAISKNHIKTIDQLADETSSLIQLLQNSESNDESLTSLRKFCSRLSLAASEYFAQQRDLEAVHPYRI